MSLIPFVTAYLGENCYAKLAVATYGAAFVLTCCAFLLLQTVLAKQNTHDAAREAEFRRLNAKALFSICCYAASVGLAFVSIYISFAIFVFIPLMYFWPEKVEAQSA